MSGQCISPDDLGPLLVAPAVDPRWAHVAECPRCRSLVASYRSFLAGNPALADREADEEIGRRLAEEITPRPVVVGNTRSWRGPVIGASLAVAAVLATVAIFSGWPTGPQAPVIVIRGEQSPLGTVIATYPAEEMPGNKLRLTWTPVPDTETYALRLVGADLAEINHWTVQLDTVLIIPLPERPGQDGVEGDLYWQVEALKPGGVWARSELTVLHLP